MTADTEGVVRVTGDPGKGAARRRRHSSRDGFWPWVFLAPILIGMGAFYLWPIMQTFFNTFMTIGPFGGAEFAGLENYRKLLAEPDFLRSVLNTIIYAGIVLLGVPMAIVIASLLNRPGLRFATLYRTLFFMPYVAMPTAIALVWRTIYNGDFGILNTFLATFGIDGPHWISTPGYSLAALGAMGLWSALGFSLIVLSAGLQNIPSELYEAAQLDGAGPWKQFISVTVPMLTPSIFLVIVVTSINAFQLFDLLFALMGQSNPAMKQTQSMVFLFYEQGFIVNDKGYASVIAIAIMAIVAVFTLVQFRLQNRWVNYV